MSQTYSVKFWKRSGEYWFPESETVVFDSESKDLHQKAEDSVKKKHNVGRKRDDWIKIIRVDYC